ncbi:hypothetical protein G5714_024614 [Onychostoma macrolepis]|uniref:Uncharacterized protein n=1 Tax=Onychostoma macrolepis TaxID=369639 RepID=A0A7J6BIX6_9TELE|nr:hypothetical protein G5714_024614 [Onychostoma macrolepis]
MTQREEGRNGHAHPGAVSHRDLKGRGGSTLPACDGKATISSRPSSSAVTPPLSKDSALPTPIPELPTPPSLPPSLPPPSLLPPSPSSH